MAEEATQHGSSVAAGRAESGSSRGGDEAVPTEFTARRLVSIQCLRGIAALMVVVHHVLHQSPGFLAVWPTEALQAGVDLFFVISGFVMVYVTVKSERSPLQFLAMRAARIVPLYWAFTLLAAALLLLLPQLFRSNEFSIRHVILSMLFLPHAVQVDGSWIYTPVVKQGWTLIFEVFFYVLFALAMFISIRRRVPLAVLALATIAVLGHAMRSQDISLGAAGFYFNDIILEFGFGMLIAAVAIKGKLDSINTVFAVFLVIGGFLMMFMFDGNRAVIFGLPAVAIVIGSLAFENRHPIRMRPLQFFGDTSYSIYLVHIFPIAVLRAIWPVPMDGPKSLLLFLAATLVLVIGFSAISYYGIERTSLRYLRPRMARVR
jgi:peptidoglycan/LPS O-acetylase OafA/YrhL